MSDMHAALQAEPSPPNITWIQQYVAAQKTAHTVSPIRPIPIKPSYQLYTHQVKAYNIALALMGYDPEGGRRHDPA